MVQFITVKKLMFGYGFLLVAYMKGMHILLASQAVYLGSRFQKVQ